MASLSKSNNYGGSLWLCSYLSLYFLLAVCHGAVATVFGPAQPYLARRVGVHIDAINSIWTFSEIATTIMFLVIYNSRDCSCWGGAVFLLLLLLLLPQLQQQQLPLLVLLLSPYVLHQMKVAVVAAAAAASTLLPPAATASALVLLVLVLAAAPSYQLLNWMCLLLLLW